MSTISEFLIAMESCYREYDSSAFIQNAKGAICGQFQPQMIDLQNDIYERNLRNSIKELSETYMDDGQCEEFFRNTEQTSRFDNLCNLPAMCNCDFEFRLNYLKDYSENLTIATGKLIESIDSNESSEAGIASYARMASEELLDAIKKQVVRTSYDTIYDASTETKLCPEDESVICYDRNYITSNVIPFVTKFSSMKEETISSAMDMISIINDLIQNTTIRNKVVVDLCNKNPDYCRTLNRVNYQLNRTIIDILGFVSYAMILKISCIVKNAKTCNLLMNQMRQASRPMQKIISEGVFSSIIPDNTGDVADELINGNIGAFEDLSNNLMNFHSLVLQNNNVQLIDGLEYNTEPYNTVLEIMAVILSSLDTLYGASDDYLLVFTELIEKAGLENPIDVRYKDRVSMIAETPEYDSATEIAVNGNGNLEVYTRILLEIKDFPDNMRNIAAQITDVRSKAEEISNRFDNNVNREYQNSNSIEELKVFMHAFDEQLENLVSTIAGNFMIRLKKLAMNAERISLKIESPSEDLELLESEFVDYEVESAKIILEYQQEFTDVLMECLMEEYQKIWLKNSRHLELVQEVGEPTISTKPKSDGASTTTGTSQTNVTGTNQSQVASSEAQTKRNISDKLTSLKDNLKRRFQEMITKFKDNMSKKTITESVFQESGDGMRLVTEAAVPYRTWLENNKNGLLTRSYANVSLQILPYSTKMPYSQIVSEADRFRNTVTAIRPGDVSTLKTDADIFNRLYSAQGVVNFASGTKVDECKSQASTALTKYYKVGKAPLEMVTYSNNNLKSLMTDIVRFCESYFGGEEDHLTGILNGIAGSVETMTSSFVTEGTEMIYEKLQTLYEADGESTTPTVTTTATSSTTTTTKPNASTNSMTPLTMINTIQEGVSVYSGSVLNAVRDRIDDYFRAMSRLKPKTTQPTNQPQQPTTGA